MKTWFITGVSSGLGLALAKAVIASGDKVAGTLRTEEQRVTFSQMAQGQSFGFVLDVCSEMDIPRVVAQVEEEVGPIDVLVNNAGYGYEGAIEEALSADIRAQFDVNVFGAISVIQAVLPYMRKRRSGHIINITSICGLLIFPGAGIYNASKFALEGINETLASEVKAFGIKVTAVEPAAFRTDWAGRSMHRPARLIEDYEPFLGPLAQARAERSGKQPGDPVKAAQAIIALVGSDSPPVHLILGPDGLRLVRAKLKALGEEIDAWEHLSASTDFSI